MIIEGDDGSDEVVLQVNDTPVDCANNLTFLGSIRTRDGESMRDVERGIGTAKSAASSLIKILRD